MITSHNYIILYADDILLISSSLYNLQNLLFVWKRELMWLDTAINVLNSHCLRIEPRFDEARCNIVCTSSHVIHCNTYAYNDSQINTQAY